MLQAEDRGQPWVDRCTEDEAQWHIITTISLTHIGFTVYYTHAFYYESNTTVLYKNSF